jgi:hypothetical protein
MRSAALCDDKVKECLLGSESEESLSDSEFDSDNELDDCALLNVVVDGDSDKDDDIIQDFVWEDMNNYKGQRKNFTGIVGPQGAAKEVTEIVGIFELFFNSKLIDKIVEETNRYAEQSLWGHKLSSRSNSRAWKPVRGRNLCCTRPIYGYGHYSKTYPEIIFHHKKGDLETL